VETKWLEDFVSLAETRSFSRSAQLRHVTQPAFSRRIQALEAWAGIDLVDRSSYPTRLTPAGETLHAQALEILVALQSARNLMRSHRASGQDVIEFAINTNGRRAHPAYPGGFEVDIDTNGDGLADFAVYNSELGAFGTSGQTVVNVVDLATGAGGIYYYADADLNSGNIILTAPASVMGLTPGQTISFDVLAYDNYFSGNVSDSIAGMRFTPGNPRYAAASGITGSVPRLSSANLPVVASTVADTASSESGLLLMYRRNAVSEADAIRLR